MTTLISLKRPNFGLIFLFLLGAVLALVVMASPRPADAGAPFGAVPISLGESIVPVSTPTGSHFYSFNVPTDDTMILAQMVGDIPLFYMALYNDSDDLLIENDDDEECSDPGTGTSLFNSVCILAVLGAGDYYIEVNEPEDVGTYIFQLLQGVPSGAPTTESEGSEGNDTLETADSTVLGNEYAGEILPAGDIDIATFFASAGTRVGIAWTGGSLAPPLNPELTFILDPFGTPLHTFPCTGFGLFCPPVITPADGFYFLSVSGLSPSDKGTYAYQIQPLILGDPLDEDGDGVSDFSDQCSGTPGGETADANGCSPSQLDDDDDGVSDASDLCSGTPGGEPVDDDGCSLSQDEDGDGVRDGSDLCSGTPGGEPVDDDGCSSSQFDEDGDGLGHFLNYDSKVSKHTQKFEKRMVMLSDQFEQDVVYEVKKLKGLYNPVEKQVVGESEATVITDSDSHLVGYDIKLPKGTPKPERITGILIDNQFGQLWLDTKKADRLLVPSVKSLDGPIEVVPTAFPIDHFICYKVKLTKDVDGNELPEGLQVALKDQFGQDATYDVKKVKRLCNPVSKTVLDEDGLPTSQPPTSIIDPAAHLVCYDIKRPKGTPKDEKFQKVSGINIDNQFGPLEIDAKKPKELCVPSTKILT